MNQEAVQIPDDETKLMLPIELVEDIFCRLPVKLLQQLRCMCKSWNFLISSRKFACKHLSVTKAYEHHHHLMLITKTESDNLLLWNSHITCIFNTLSSSQTSLPLPDHLNTDDLTRCFGDCHGIICLTIRDSYPVLWNPSTRQYSVIPPVENSFPPPKHYVNSFIRNRPQDRRMSVQANFYSFGYDNTTHKYKIVAISFIRNPRTPKTGLSVSGIVNWLVCGPLIVSLDLVTETYQELLLPTAIARGSLTLGVLNDFLCIFDCNDRGTDIWMVMEFGNEESWHILYTIPSIAVQHPCTKVLYISEDEQFLMLHDGRSQWRLGVYHSRNYTSNVLELQHRAYMDIVVYTESLISPCSLATVDQ